MKKILFILLLTTVNNGYAQDDGIRATNVLMPEAYTFKFNSAGSVDYHGDYSASIPLMTVPGRGGMDYSINLSYKSGITTDQRATWVGLGWNLNPGSITRVVNGIPDNITGFMFPNAVTENGAIVNYDATAGTGGWQFPDKDYLDFFLVNIPGLVSGLVVPVAADGDSTPDYVFQEYNGWSIGFGSGTTFNRLHVPAINSPGTEYTDIGFIHLRDPNGNVYVFGLPLRSEMVWYNPAPYFLPRFIIEYVSSWQLTSILSPDFSMANYNNGDLIPSENAGTWVKFEYNYPYNGNNARVRNIRPLYFDRAAGYGDGNHKDPFGLLTQTTYLSKIITPTHEAVFETTPRVDISFLSPYSTAYAQMTGVIGDYTNSPNGTTGTFIKPLRLDRIKLYRRFPTSTFTNHQVEFKYAATGQELCRYGYSLTVNGIALNGIGKTTLKEVVIGGESSGHLYRFKYTDEIDGFNPVYIATPDPRVGLSSPIQAIEKHEGSSYATEAFNGTTYYRARSGRMGFLFALASELSGASAVIQNTKAAAAWSLRTIEYPTGAVDTIVYELDDFDKATDQSHSSLSQHPGWWDNFAPDESGLRVAHISSYDPITAEARKTIYQYEGGHLPGLPISFLRNQNAWVGVDQLRAFLFGYSSSEVEYRLVKTLFADGSRSETRYTSVEDAFGAYDQQTASYNYILVQDRGCSRGKPLYTHHYDSNNRLTSRQSNTYVNTKLYSGYPPPDLMLAMDPNNWSYYVGGKRLSECWTIKRVIDSTYQYELDVTGAQYVPQIGVTNYAYNNYMQITFQNVLLRNSRLQTTYGYVHEMGLAESGTFKTKHILNSLGYKKTVETKNNTSITRSHTLYSWAQFNGDYRIDTVYTWMDVNQDLTADEGEWVPLKTVLSYDDYGNPLSIKDANGTVSNFEWSATYQNSKLTKLSTVVGGIELTRRYTYNVLLLPDSQEDENGQKTTYLYDAVGRLISVKGPNNETLKSYIYNFKNTGTILGGGY